MDFALTPEMKTMQARVREFIASEVVPLERDPRWEAHGPTEDLRNVLIARGRTAGLLSAHMPQSLGGLALNHKEKAVFFEEAGYSPLGPLALNINAPDEGNMHLMEVVCNEAQKKRWLAPLAAGEHRSCFAMTEPDGAGSDPSLLATLAHESQGGYRITGRKWFITGAMGAHTAIIMAKHADGLFAGRASMFLAEMKSPGITVERMMNTIDAANPGGHCVVQIDDLFVPHAEILGAPGDGFRYAQVRLAPARLTHCMRWLGAARRAHEVALAYAQRRMAFGKPLIEHEGVGFMLADNEMDLHTTRLATWYCAWALDGEDAGRTLSSATKVIASEGVWRVADRCVQILGGQGTTDETIVARIFTDMRAFRIYDGPSEVHRWSIAKHLRQPLA